MKIPPNEKAFDCYIEAMRLISGGSDNRPAYRHNESFRSDNALIKQKGLRLWIETSEPRIYYVLKTKSTRRVRRMILQGCCA